MISLTVSYAGRREELIVDDDEVITFPRGLVGCADWRRFVLLSDRETPDLHILHCLDDSSVSLLVTNPMLVAPAYRVGISQEELRNLALTRLEDGILLCILTCRSNPPHVTANLLGPLVLNPSGRLGLQLALADSPYTTRHPLPELPLTGGEAPHVSA